MTTTTTTTTTQTPATYVLRLEQFPQLKQSYEAQISDLRGILQKYLGWNDFLSQRLHRWGVKITGLNLNNSFNTMQPVTETDLRKEATRRIDKLYKKILVNPHQPGVALIAPMLDGDWTCEASTLIAWKELWRHPQIQSSLPSGTLPEKPLSPFDEYVIAEEQHLFAEEIMNFAQKFLAQNVHSDPQVSISNTITAIVSIPAATKILTMTRFALQIPDLPPGKFAEILSSSKSWMAKEKSYWERKASHKRKDEDKAKSEEDRRYADQVIGAAQQENQRTTATINQNISNIQKTCESSIITMSSRVDRTETDNADLRTNQTRLEDEVNRERLRANQALMNNASLQNEINQVRASAGGKKGCSIQ